VVSPSQSISDVSAVNSLVAFYDIHGLKGEVLFFCSVPETPHETAHNILYKLTDMFEGANCCCLAYEVGSQDV
jgi:hypothetical protein